MVSSLSSLTEGHDLPLWTHICISKHFLDDMSPAFGWFRIYRMTVIRLLASDPLLRHFLDFSFTDRCGRIKLIKIMSCTCILFHMFEKK